MKEGKEVVKEATVTEERAKGKLKSPVQQSTSGKKNDMVECSNKNRFEMLNSIGNDVSAPS